MVGFLYIALNALASSLFIFCALILASIRDRENGVQKIGFSASFLIACLGILKFLFYSYPLAAAWTDSRLFSFVLMACVLTCIVIYFLVRNTNRGFHTALYVLASAIVIEAVMAIWPVSLLLGLQCLLLALASFLSVRFIFGSPRVTRAYLEGLGACAILFALAVFLVVHMEANQTCSILSRAYEAVRTYQQVVADTEKRLLSDTKLLALDIQALSTEEWNDASRLFLWQKMLGVHSVSFLENSGIVVCSSHIGLRGRDVSFMKVVSSALSGTASAAIQKSMLDQEPVLLVSRPVFSENYSISGAILLEATLKDIVGDDFLRDGLFFLDGKNELIFGNKDVTGRLLGILPSSSMNGHHSSKSFCIYDQSSSGNEGPCFNGNFFRLISLPLYKHDVTVAKIFSTEEILLNRFELALAIFLSGTIYLILLHKFIKNRFYSVRLQNEIRSRKKAEERLKTLASVVEQAVESIVITDPSGTIRYVNPFYTRLTGYKAQEVIGTKADFAREDESNAFAFKEIWRALLQGEAWSGRLISKAKDGKNLIEDCVIFPIKKDAGNVGGIVAIRKDVTREKELESLLLHAQKMESIGMLAGGIAHDFNNILAAIQINLDLIPLFNYEPEKTKKYLDKIQYGVTRATDLVRQLLIFSRRKMLERDIIDLNQAVSNLLSMVESTLGENIRLEVKGEKGLWPILADPGVVDQIIMNLVVNAKDAMPEGGTLTISTSNVVLDKPGLEKKFVKLSISDTGLGMKKDVLEQIFDPFFTTKEIGKGTGLGLSVVYGIVKQHGGFIDVNSQETKGTTFDIYFPAAPKAAAKGKDRGEDVSSIQGQGQKILLVEDEEAVRKVIREVLLENGYIVTSCKTLQEARDALKEKGPFDLLLSDVVLPDGSGVDLASELRKTNPTVSILLMSGYVDKRVKEEEIKRLGFSYFRKPFKISRLLSAIADALDKSSKTD